MIVALTSLVSEKPYSLPHCNCTALHAASHLSNNFFPRIVRLGGLIPSIFTTKLERVFVLW